VRCITAVLFCSGEISVPTPEYSSRKASEEKNSFSAEFLVKKGAVNSYVFSCGLIISLAEIEHPEMEINSF
jgi:hypothetical protein